MAGERPADDWWNALVPELICSDIVRSRLFYVDVLGFEVAFERLEERFLYLTREAAQLMLEQTTGRSFLAAPLEHPYGRGMNLMIETADVDSLYRTVAESDAPMLTPIEDAWYRTGDVHGGNRQFVVQDPDGYLLRFYTDLGVWDGDPGSSPPARGQRSRSA